jgi:hypothetical protein
MSRFFMAQSWRKRVCAVMKGALRENHGANGCAMGFPPTARPWRNARAMFLTGDRFEVVGAAGQGYIRRDRCELLLIGSRGKPVWPAPGTQGESVWFARRGEHATARNEAHSDKPECSFQWFERRWPTIPHWGLDAPPEDRQDESGAGGPAPVPN